MTDATPMMMPSMVRKLRKPVRANARQRRAQALLDRVHDPWKLPPRSAATLTAEALHHATSATGVGLRRIFDDPPVVQSHDAPAMTGDPGIVRDDDDRLAFGMQLAEQRHDFGGRAAVEIAGRLVGQQQLRSTHQRARDGHALPLAAGQLIRFVQQAIAEPDARQGVDRARCSA